MGVGGPPITASTGGAGPRPIAYTSPVAGAHEPTYQLTLDPANYADIEAGATQITLTFSYQNN